MSGGADRLVLLAEEMRSMCPEDRQKVIDRGKADPSATVRLFFSELERNLRQVAGQLPPAAEKA